MLFPYLSHGDTQLHPTSPRGAEELFASLPPEAARATGSDLFGSLYCPDNPSTIGAQFDILDEKERWVGTATLFSLDLNSGRARAAIHLHPGEEEHEKAATLLTINYAFSTWRLHKTYVWSTPSKRSALEEMPGIAEQEAHLESFFYSPEGLTDVNIFAVYRNPWEQDGLKHLEHLT